MRIICPDCHYNGKPAWKKRGNIRTEIRLWLMLGVGAFYSLWRIFSQTPMCKSCKNEYVIDEKSAVGQRLLAQMEFTLVKPNQMTAKLQRKPEQF